MQAEEHMSMLGAKGCSTGSAAATSARASQTSTKPAGTYRSKCFQLQDRTLSRGELLHLHKRRHELRAVAAAEAHARERRDSQKERAPGQRLPLDQKCGHGCHQCYNWHHVSGLCIAFRCVALHLGWSPWVALRGSLRRAMCAWQALTTRDMMLVTRDVAAGSVHLRLYLPLMPFHCAPLLQFV